jgi:malate dehydrogenase (oxaloacetate-decarboxylating)
LEGLLPAQCERLDQQVERCWQAFQSINQPLEQFSFVDGLRRSNLVLFHAFLRTHLEAVLPVVYTPTVGAVIQRFSQNYRTPQDGIFLNASQAGRLEQVLRTGSHAGIALVLVTDAEAAFISVKASSRCTRCALA